MNKNVDKTDRIVRILGGIGVLAGAFFADGGAAIFLFILSAILLGTGLAGYCPVYSLIGRNGSSCCSKGDCN